MLKSHTIDSKPSHVTVTFGDRTHVFPLPKNASLVELANFIAILGAHHDTAPLSIDVAFSAGDAHLNASRKTRSH